MIVTIGGSVASGKSTLAERLSKRLGFKRLSAGQIMREMAAERGVSLLEFSRYAEEHPEVDREIDERQRKVASTGNYVVDGRLSAHFLKPDLSVWLNAPVEVRASRILDRGEKYRSLEEASEAISQREASERKRYREFYGIDLDDMRVYDMVLNTGK
ncbi:MAG: AAA family ATPase, partial [Candidatus Altiarchaeota archaeon]|nr:AAA family ATPase [Candidatus Altiarchaeota archaeon]